MADTPGAGSGAASDGNEKSFDAASLKSGVKLQAGTSLKISVKGVAGRPLPSGKRARPLPSSDDAGDAGDATAAGEHGGSSAGGQTVDDSNTGGGGASGSEDNGDKHVLAAEVHTIGDSLLINHPVRIWSITTGEQVAEGKTDEKGVLRVDVPKEDNYRIEILDEALTAEGPEGLGPHWSAADLRPLLRALFTDPKGAPIANEAVSVTVAGKTFQLTTDESGLVQTSGPLAPHTLKLRGKTFTAHSLPAQDHADDANTYRFVVAGKAEAA